MRSEEKADLLLLHALARQQVIPLDSAVASGSRSVLEGQAWGGQGRTRTNSKLLSMLARDKAIAILRSLSALPNDKVAEVEDFVHFLEQRYAVDDSDSWTDDDLRDLTAAVLSRSDS